MASSVEIKLRGKHQILPEELLLLSKYIDFGNREYNQLPKETQITQT